jgi:hypothetical protein
MDRIRFADARYHPGFSFYEQMMNLCRAMPVSAPFCDIFKRVAERH